jgi:hypothetical protein
MDNKSKIYMPPTKKAKQKSENSATKAEANIKAEVVDFGTSSTDSITEPQVPKNPKRTVLSRAAVHTPTNTDSDEIVSIESDHETPTSNSCGDEPSSSTRNDPHNGLEVTSDDEEEWEIERLVARRRTKSGKLIYQARWKGWGPEWDEWKTVSQLRYAQELVREYEAKLAKWENRVAYGDYQHFT